MEIGFSLSSEEHRPNALVDQAAEAEQRGFTFALISDHFHPWTHTQGQSPFVWSVIGGIARATSTLRLGTGVTCPTIRTHPAIVAQAAATSASMMPGRFFLGVGSGENLNEHITGARWPEADVRLEMLEEAVEVIRLLWEGGSQSHRGRHYTLENARIYTLPEQPTPIYVAAAGEKAGRLAGEIGDGLIGVGPGPVLEVFDEAGGRGKPKYGQVTVCYAESESEAKATALKWWPNAALEGELAQELPTPAHFEQATSWVDEDTIAEKIPCGPDPETHIQAIREYADAGYTHVYVHQVGPDQASFFKFYEREVLPNLTPAMAGR
ncbi:MAG TPA: TIGR03557 family F420-dependent LLM class oxidoreductase [Actinomycetota bacterium]|nr:TIGR03557 family F420-dependent LLM class oxidoreductase [Actinomycetota bacterium]